MGHARHNHSDNRPISPTKKIMTDQVDNGQPADLPVAPTSAYENQQRKTMGNFYLKIIIFGFQFFGQNRRPNNIVGAGLAPARNKFTMNNRVGASPTPTWKY
jgi:hypothetical protein